MFKKIQFYFIIQKKNNLVLFITKKIKEEGYKIQPNNYV